LRKKDYPTLQSFYDICDESCKTYDDKIDNLYPRHILKEVRLGIFSMCQGAESKYFNGHTNITDDKFIVFGVKGLMDTNKKLKDAMLFNLRSLVYCKECNRRMKSIDSYSTRYSKKQFIRYSCVNDRHHVKYCNKNASQDLIKIVVMDSIRVQMKLLIDRAELIKTARTAGSGKYVFR
jgi:hypothetical protein